MKHLAYYSSLKARALPNFADVSKQPRKLQLENIKMKFREIKSTLTVVTNVSK